MLKIEGYEAQDFGSEGIMFAWREKYPLLGSLRC